MEQNEELLQSLMDQNKKLVEMMAELHRRMFAQLVIFGAFITNHFNRSDETRAEFDDFAQTIRKGVQRYQETGPADSLDVAAVEEMLVAIQREIDLDNENPDEFNDFPEFIS